MSIALIPMITWVTLTMAPPYRLGDAQDIAGMRWCNIYFDRDLLPEVSEGSIQHSGSEKALKVKIGKSLDVSQYNVMSKMKWWADFVIAPDVARDKQFMYFYPVSALNDDSLGEIVRSISENSGREKPLFAMAVTSSGLSNLGVDIATPSTSGLVVAPVWWNGDIADTMRNAISGYASDPNAMTDSLAHLVGYTVASSVTYDPVPDNCNPTRVPNENLAILTADPTLQNVTYFGVSEPINSLSADVTPTIVMKREWPVIN